MIALLLGLCPSFDKPRALPAVDEATLTESSGLAAATRSPGLWFTLNDSGGAAALYAFDEGGVMRGISTVTGATNTDWEDLAAGPCPTGGGPCLFIADIGDNLERRPSVTVYAVPEPLPGQSTAPVATWTLRYPDGAGHDAEALLVHGDERLIVTKRRDGRSTVYRLPAAAGPGTLETVGEVDLSGREGWQRRITGGAFSPDGQSVALRSYGPIYVFENAPGGFWTKAPAIVYAGSLEQEEAVAFAPDGGLRTTSEGRPMPVLAIDCLRGAGLPSD